MGYQTENHSNLTDMDNQADSLSAQSSLEREVASLMVTALNLEIQPAEIEAEAPLYGAGLGLDSIDVLEIALEISKRYGFQLRADNEDNVKIFSSLRSLSTHIQEHRTQ
jgi:acyl carrier protein